MMNMNRYQPAPPEANNDDEAFLSLLSSQRELLNHLNQENAEHKARSAFGGYGDGSMRMGYHPANNSFNVSPNRSICDPSFRTDNFVYSKGISLGMENEMMAPSSWDDSFSKLGNPLGLDSSYDLDLSLHSTRKNTIKRDKDDLGLDDVMSFKKRRLSATGLFNPLSIFVDNAEQQKQFQQTMHRRLSLSPFGDRLHLPADESFLDEDEDDFFMQPMRATPVLEQVSIPPRAPVMLTVQRPKPKKARQQLLLTGDPEEARKTLMSLSSTMEKSQKSQQDIHDWDRKMGLKRSHSKTMRLSTRSRKKLRAMLKKQINALAPKKR